MVPFARPKPIMPAARRNPATMSLLLLAGEVEYAKQVLTYWERLTAPSPEPKPPSQAKRGRRKGTYDIPNDELFDQMFDARQR